MTIDDANAALRAVGKALVVATHYQSTHGIMSLLVRGNERAVRLVLRDCRWWSGPLAGEDELALRRVGDTEVRVESADSSLRAICVDFWIEDMKDWVDTESAVAHMASFASFVVDTIPSGSTDEHMELVRTLRDQLARVAAGDKEAWAQFRAESERISDLYPRVRPHSQTGL